VSLSFTKRFARFWNRWNWCSSESQYRKHQILERFVEPERV